MIDDSSIMGGFGILGLDIFGIILSDWRVVVVVLFEGVVFYDEVGSILGVNDFVCWILGLLMD